MSTKLLELVDVNAYYGKSHVLQGITIEVNAGEVVALLGRNGSGRSTTLKAVMGLVDTRGKISMDGVSIAGQAPVRTCEARYRVRSRGPPRVSQPHRW